MSERLATLAVLIGDMHGAYGRRELKRGGADFLSGLVKAYAILTGTDDLDAALQAALTEAKEETS